MLFSDWFTLLFTIVCKPIHDNPKEASHGAIHDMSIRNEVPDPKLLLERKP